MDSTVLIKLLPPPLSTPPPPLFLALAVLLRVAGGRPSAFPAACADLRCIFPHHPNPSFSDEDTRGPCASRRGRESGGRVFSRDRSDSCSGGGDHRVRSTCRARRCRSF